MKKNVCQWSKGWKKHSAFDEVSHCFKPAQHAERRIQRKQGLNTDMLKSSLWGKKVLKSNTVGRNKTIAEVLGSIYIFWRDTVMDVYSLSRYWKKPKRVIMTALTMQIRGLLWHQKGWEEGKLGSKESVKWHFWTLYSNLMLATLVFDALYRG